MPRWHEYGKAGRVPTPCVTCGLMSTSWFPDGSPLWPGHSHPKPYYRDDSVTIYHADFEAVEVKADLVIADPPFDEWWRFAERVALMEPRSLVAFTTFQHREHLDVLGRPRAELIWTFADGRWTSHNLPRTNHETILVYGETGDAYVGRPMSHVEPQRKGAGHVGKTRMPEREWRPRDRALLDSHLAYARDVASGLWAKPLPLIEQLVEWLCPPGGTVLDLFTGSGTALVAAKNLGRKAIGFDIDEAACKRAAQRCSQEVLGLPA